MSQQSKMAMNGGIKKEVGEETKQITKLEQQVNEFERELTITAKEQDIIKGYKMKEGDYQVIVKVYEANDLEPRGTDFLFFRTEKTACEAFVEIEVGDQTKKTEIKQETNNPIFDQRFVFKFSNMRIEELDRACISFKVYDKKTFVLKDSLLGSFEMDWTNVYFKRNHEIYRGWLTLMDPNDEQTGIMGYLLVDVAVLGQTDQITVHDSAFIKDPLTTIEDTITMPKLTLIDYGIRVQIYRAQNLVPLDEFAGNVDAYVIAKFSGNKVETSSRSSSNPQWNQSLQIGTGVPTKSKYLILEVRNKNFLKDDIIGVLQIPFIDLEEDSKPKWGHLYGPPMSGTDAKPYDYATKMQLHGQTMGSHYRGRIFYQVTGRKDSLLTNKRSKINFKFPFRPTPFVAVKSYNLRLDFLDGIDLPEVGQKCFLHACIGQYLVRSEELSKSQNRYKEFLTRLELSKLSFPEDHTQIPDLILYFAKGPKERDRISYVRIKAADIISEAVADKFKILELQPDFSLNSISNEPAGYLSVRAHLFTGYPPKVQDLKAEMNSSHGQFVLKCFVYRGKQFPPMNENGDCNAVMEIKCAGRKQETRIVSSCYNPIWNQVISFRLSTFDLFSLNLEVPLSCTLYDSTNAHRKVIGSFLVKISSRQKKIITIKDKPVEYLYCKPKWYPVVNRQVHIGDPCFGHALFGCVLMRESSKSELNINLERIEHRFDEKTFQLFLIGLRDVKTDDGIFIANNQAVLEIKLGNEWRRTEAKPLKEGAVHYNTMLSFTPKLPKNRCLNSYVDFRLLFGQSESHDPTARPFYAYGSVSLYDILPKLKQAFQEKQQMKDCLDSSDSEQTILDVENLSEHLKIVKRIQKRRQAKLKQLQGNRCAIDSEHDVEEMKLPREFGPVSTTDTEGTLKSRLDELLLRDVEKYQTDVHYSYVKALEKQRDQQSEVRLAEPRISRAQSSERDASEKMQMPMLITQNRNRKYEYDQLEGEHNSTNKGLNRINNHRMGSSDLLRNNNEENTRLMETELAGHQTEFEVQKYKQIKYNNSDEIMANGVSELRQSYRFRDEKEEIRSQMGEQVLQEVNKNSEAEIRLFDIDDNESLAEVPHDQRVITYHDLQRIIQQEEQYTKEALQKMENYKYAAAVKLSLFSFKNRKEDKHKQTYLDYDTDEQENLDIIPEWYKGRKILPTDLEDCIVQRKKISSLPLIRGGDQIANLDIRRKSQIGNVRFVAVSVPTEAKKAKEKFYQTLLKPKSFICRIYILKGKSLISNYRDKPTTYLRISCRGQTFDLRDQTHRAENYNPEYFVCQQIPMELPGSSKIRVEVLEEDGFINKSLKKAKVLGFTEIDIEERYFMKKWHFFMEKKPIELRNLYSEYGIGSQGRLETWVDLIPKKDWMSNPPYKIHPPPFDKYELRVIVWETKDCVYKNEAFGSNDVFVRGFLGTSEAQETDTHWACRRVGSFNWRFKYPVHYPPKPEDMYSDQFIIQIWDRDVIGYNNLIGEKRINLNKIHRIIEKAVKRRKAVKAKMKIREKSLVLTEKFWFDVYNHKVKDQFGQLESQGKVRLSFELIPAETAEKQLQNGYGRSEPNMYPTLQEPVGRLNFNLLHPLDFCKQLCGPQLYRSICKKIVCCVILVIFAVFAYLFLGNLAANAVSSTAG